MPRVSERQKCLKMLDSLLHGYYSGSWVRDALPFLPNLVSHLRKQRFWTKRDVVFTISRWSPSYIDFMDETTLRRDIRVEKSTYCLSSVVLNAVKSFIITTRIVAGKRMSGCSYRISYIFYRLEVMEVHTMQSVSGVGEGSVRNFVTRVSFAVNQFAPEYLVWPTTRERAQISARIAVKSGFRGLCGMIDGTTFRLSYKPQRDPEDYFCRKSCYCVSAQIICDDRRMIRQILVGILEVCMICGNFKP